MNICKKTLKFYRLLYLRPPHLFHLSLSPPASGGGARRGSGHCRSLRWRRQRPRCCACRHARALGRCPRLGAVRGRRGVRRHVLGHRRRAAALRHALLQVPRGLWAFDKLSLASAIMLCLGRLLLSQRSRHPGSPLLPLGLKTAARRSRGRHAPSIQMPSPPRAARPSRRAPLPAMLCSGTKPPPQTNPPQAWLAAPIPHA